VEEVDVVVVGSGAGGAPVALTLARAGKRVLVLEKGPRRALTDFLHDEIAMCRRDFFTPLLDDDPHTLRRSEDEAPIRTNAGWISRCVGGGTVHMSGFFLRFQPKDFAAWPFTYEVLAPHYDRVERELGVSGDESANPFAPPRSGPYPHPPVLTHPIASRIDEAGKKLGMHPFPIPRAIITEPREGRSACVYCPLCGSYGCEVSAKSSTLASLLPAAEKTGRCEVRPNAMVRRVVMMKNGRASGVTYLDEKDVEHEVRAGVVVIACSAIESARLLLLSRSERHPNGLGNEQGQVGKNLCFSTLGQLQGRLFYRDFDDSLRSPMPFVGRAVQDFYAEGGTFHLLWEHPNPIHSAEKLIRDGGRLVYGRELMDRMYGRFVESRTLEVECFGEWTPTEGCYVSLDDRVTDRWGLPSARITIARDPSDRSKSELLVEKARQLLEALGAKEIETLAVGGETLVLQHGTCRMGTDPRSSVTTPDGRLHQVDNVYVTDGASLPSSGAVPSTLTIMANAFRIADRIAG
jgi:choline dehydrogenase-like flavoprotein